MEKSFFEVFKRYNPDEKKRRLLESARDVRVKLQRTPMRVEVDMSFGEYHEADILYEIEDECRTLYSAESFKIMPHFPPEEYNISRWGEIAY